MHLPACEALFVLLCLSVLVASVSSHEEGNKLHTDKPGSGKADTIFTDHISARTTHGLLIDGGSGGSRLHIYTWLPRVFKTVPPAISFPTTNDETSMARVGGGVQECWQAGQTQDELDERVKDHFLPMIDFVREKLASQEHSFASIPIWFKATGGARELSPSARGELLASIRALLSSKQHSPFFFRGEMARVISGEEEAVFSWACMNFLKGNLIEASSGSGQVTPGYGGAGADLHSFGTLDLGGSSTQIAFYLKSEDYMEGLYKLQIGGQKHWNVYTKSFLQFGINSARRRSYGLLAAKAIKALLEKDEDTLDLYDISTTLSSANVEKIQQQDNLAIGIGTGVLEVDTATSKAIETAGAVTLTRTLHTPLHVDEKSRHISIRNPCFHSGYEETASGIVLDTDNPGESTVDVSVLGPLKQEKGKNVQLNLCLQELRPLMEKSSNGYCNLVYHGECSIGGGYQPALPQGDSRHFFATSSYKLPWAVLRLPNNVTLSQFADSAGQVCAMNLEETKAYVKENNLEEKDAKLGITNHYFCFMAAYTLTLLQDGYGFTEEDTITVIDKVNGFSTGWPLGAILHEINNLPWELDYESMIGREKEPYIKDFLIGFFGAVMGAYIGIKWYAEVTTKNGANDRMPLTPSDDLRPAPSSSSPIQTKTQGIYQTAPFKGGSSSAGYQQVADSDL